MTGGSRQRQRHGTGSGMPAALQGSAPQVGRAQRWTPLSSVDALVHRGLVLRAVQASVCPPRPWAGAHREDFDKERAKRSAMAAKIIASASSMHLPPEDAAHRGRERGSGRRVLRPWGADTSPSVSSGLPGHVPSERSRDDRSGECDFRMSVCVPPQARRIRALRALVDSG